MARDSAPDTTAAYDGFAIRRGRVGPPRASRYGLRPVCEGAPKAKARSDPSRQVELACGRFALAFALLSPLPAGTPRSRAYSAMNSSVFSRASESGRWLCGDFIR